MVELWRERWAELANERLAELDIDARIDHRSLEAQGIALEPQSQIGAPANASLRTPVKNPECPAGLLLLDRRVTATPCRHRKYRTPSPSGLRRAHRGLHRIGSSCRQLARHQWRERVAPELWAVECHSGDAIGYAAENFLRNSRHHGA